MTVRIVPPVGHSNVAWAVFTERPAGASAARAQIRAALAGLGAPGMAGTSVSPTRNGLVWLFSLDVTLDRPVADTWPDQEIVATHPRHIAWRGVQERMSKPGDPS